MNIQGSNNAIIATQRGSARFASSHLCKKQNYAGVKDRLDTKSLLKLDSTISSEEKESGLVLGLVGLRLLWKTSCLACDYDLDDRLTTADSAAVRTLYTFRAGLSALLTSVKSLSP